MLFNIILVAILIILVVGLQYHTCFKEYFADVPANKVVADLQTRIVTSQKNVNPLTNTISLPNAAIPIDPISAESMRLATTSVVTTPSMTGYTLKSVAPYAIPDQLPDGIQKAKQCEAAPKTCDAFNDPTFAENCGMSFDVNGTGSDGGSHVGGMYVSAFDRKRQMNLATAVETTGSAPYDPYKVYRPTIGKAADGTFSLTKDKCVIVKEKIDCATKQTFNSPNCSQCYTSKEFSRVGPETGRLPFIAYLFGAGTYSITSSNPDLNNKNGTLIGDSSVDVTIPANAEGTSFVIEVNMITPPAYLCGYIEGKTARGTFKMDLFTIIKRDMVVNAKPRISGTKTFNGFRCYTLMPGSGQKKMRLEGMIPFSFLNMFDRDALKCDNGPVITLADSATFLESDPCFGKGNAPGNYKLECLQARWIQLGGTTNGTGYPSDQQKADAIQKTKDGKPLIIDDIVDNLALIMAQATTGKDKNGKNLSISDWNNASMFGMGIPITNPCDGPVNQSGPVTPECMAYLYANKGTGSRIGPTYTLPASEYASGKEGFANENPPTFEFTPNTYNYPNTAIDPNQKSGAEFGQAIDGIDNVKRSYDAINRLANDNTKKNEERSTALNQAYGIKLGNPSSNKVIGPTQVFAVGPGYDYTKDQAASVCSKYGATVATTAQLQDAYAYGADWCFSGWVADGGGKWPITTSVIGGCGGRTGIIEWTPDSQKAGVNCYGPKPGITDPSSQGGAILPFNQQMWDRPSDPTYLTIPSGYLESTGPQPSCFSGLSLDDAQKGCNSLGSQCVGFSYSKDGSGNGCYKGNHNAGINGNPAYMGYVKIPVANASAVITGRYIKVQYDRVECLNLAEIKVYGTKGGPNLITPNTPVTKSSGYQGDMFPGKNFVDGDTGQTYNFVHSSCSDVPWVQVDMGSMINIYKVVVFNRVDCCQSRVLGAKLHILNDQNDTIYISDPIQSTNRTYAWFPPNTSIKVDQPDDMPNDPITYSNYSLNNRTAVVQNSLSARWTVPVDCSIKNIKFNTSGQIYGGGGWGIYYIWYAYNGTTTALLGDGFYPPGNGIKVGEYIQEVNIPVRSSSAPAGLSTTSLKKGGTLTMYFSTLETWRSFITRALNDGRTNELPFSITYQAV